MKKVDVNIELDPWRPLFSLWNIIKAFALLSCGIVTALSFGIPFEFRWLERKDDDRNRNDDR